MFFDVAAVLVRLFCFDFFEFYEFLCRNSDNLEKIRDFLECDNSFINKEDFGGQTPFFKVVTNGCFSIGLVRLLLEYGGDANAWDYRGTALLTALQSCRDETIIEALLENGANIDVQDHEERTPLHFIYCNCRWNIWTDTTLKPEWSENVLNLLLKKGLDLNKLDAHGRSPLCHALSGGADVQSIELLLSKGGSLGVCKLHDSPLQCLADSRFVLKASVFQLLLDKRKWEVDLDLLLRVVRQKKFETAVIKLLLQHLDANAVNTWIRQTGDALHMVVNNRYTKPFVVELFIERGACVDKLNGNGETVLHGIMRGDYPVPKISVAKVLLKSGVPVNAKCNSNKTALSMAVSWPEFVHGLFKYGFIKLLLAFGARIGASCDRNGVSLLKSTLILSDRYEREKHVFEILVKYYFLEFPDFKLQSLIEGHRDYESLSVFAAKCEDELLRMESLNVRCDCTLRRYISGNFLLDAKTDQETKVANDDCNHFLQILSCNEFPEYFDVMASKFLASKVGEVSLKQNLEELMIYTVIHCSVNAGLMQKVVLNSDIVRQLALFLSEEELLCLIVAFYRVDGPTCNNTPKKRNLDSKQFTKFEKRTKLG